MLISRAWDGQARGLSSTRRDAHRDSNSESRVGLGVSVNCNVYDFTHLVPNSKKVCPFVLVFLHCVFRADGRRNGEKRYRIGYPIHRLSHTVCIERRKHKHSIRTGRTQPMHTTPNTNHNTYKYRLTHRKGERPACGCHISRVGCERLRL